MKKKKLTEIGFKRIYNKENQLISGYRRAFVKCKRCKTMAAYDYVPYSLYNPIMTTPCGHSFRDYYKSF
jgi:hypothetical protein